MGVYNHIATLLVVDKALEVGKFKSNLTCHHPPVARFLGGALEPVCDVQNLASGEGLMIRTAHRLQCLYPGLIIGSNAGAIP